jgi:hypothetical protein
MALWVVGTLAPTIGFAVAVFAAIRVADADGS